MHSSSPSGLLSSPLSSSLPSSSSGLPSTLGRSQNSSLGRSYNNLSSSASSSSSHLASSPSVGGGGDILPYAVPSPSPSPQPYRDPRTVVSVYFSVLCSSPTGSAQTQFRSGPDVFKVSQSWGWKSGGLLSVKTTEEKDKGVVSGGGGSSGGGGGESLDVPGREVSLRATVLLG
ncbi:hypothetical protein K435DRAFT_787518, partial [Dendrothele bispora CBS 962.96]